MDWLDQILDDEWTIVPAGGLTGDAYVAEKNNKRLFLKRNSSPFLAVLSAEGIVPKLIWTKRLKNGDVITAQEWLEGRKLEPEEMQKEQVAHILHKIHHSSELLHMLMRLGKRPVTAEASLFNLKNILKANTLIIKNDVISEALEHLNKLLYATKQQKHVVCHCDLNHNNLIVTNENKLYLVDWDNATIADPIIDFGLLLKLYIPKSNWETWLKKYGITKNKQLLKRMYWYLIIDTIQYFLWHTERNEYSKANDRLNDLQELNEHVKRNRLN